MISVHKFEACTVIFLSLYTSGRPAFALSLKNKYGIPVSVLRCNNFAQSWRLYGSPDFMDSNQSCPTQTP